MERQSENEKQKEEVHLQNIPEPQLQEDDASQVAPIDPEQVDVPQLFEVGPMSNLEQQQEDEALQALQVDPEPEVGEQEEVLQALQGGPEPEVEQQEEGVPQVFQRPRGEILQRISHHNIVPMASELLRPSWEEARREILQQISHHNIVPMASELLRPSWEEARREILQQISHHNIVPMASELLRPSWGESRRGSLQNISLNFEEVGFRIVNIIAIDTIDIASQELTAYQRNRRALLDYILTLLFRVQFGTSTILLLVEEPIPPLALESHSVLIALGIPPPLLALEAPPPLLALEAPPSLLALEILDGRILLPVMHARPLLSDLDARPRLPAMLARPLMPELDDRPLMPELDDRPLIPELDDRPLMPELDDRPLFPAPEENESLSLDTEMYSHLQKGKRLDLQEPLEFVPVNDREPVEALAVRPQKTKKVSARKHQQRTEIFDPGQPDASLDPAELQKLLERENQEEISDPGEPNFPDPRELLKDLNLGEMKADDLKLEPIGDLELGSIRDLETEADGDLETEADGDLETEADGDLETESDGDLETEIHQPFLPPETQRPNQDEVIDIESDDAEEDAPNAAIPNNGGNRPFNRNGRCRDGEIDMEEVERQKDEDYPAEMQQFTIWLFTGLLLFIIIGNTLNILSYVFDWRGLRTHNTTVPVTDVISNVTTPMTTTIFNITSLDFDATTSTNDLILNTTDMDI